MNFTDQTSTPSTTRLPNKFATSAKAIRGVRLNLNAFVQPDDLQKGYDEWGKLLEDVGDKHVHRAIVVSDSPLVAATNAYVTVGLFHTSNVDTGAQTGEVIRQTFSCEMTGELAEGYLQSQSLGVSDNVFSGTVVGGETLTIRQGGTTGGSTVPTSMGPAQDGPKGVLLRVAELTAGVDNIDVIFTVAESAGGPYAQHPAEQYLIDTEAGDIQIFCVDGKYTHYKWILYSGTYHGTTPTPVPTTVAVNAKLAVAYTNS